MVTSYGFRYNANDGLIITKWYIPSALPTTKSDRAVRHWNYIVQHISKAYTTEYKFSLCCSTCTLANTVKHVHAVTFIKQSPVLEGHLFLICHRKFYINKASF